MIEFKNQFNEMVDIIPVLKARIFEILDNSNVDVDFITETDLIRALIVQACRGQMVNTSKYRTDGSCGKRSVGEYFANPSDSLIAEIRHDIFVRFGQFNSLNIPSTNNNLVEFLEFLSRVGWNVRKNDINRFIQWIADANYYIAQGSNPYDFQSGLLMQSTVRGGGKTTTLKNLNDVYSRICKTTTRAKVPSGRFADCSVFTRNHVAFIEDVQKGNESFNQDQMMNVLRHENVSYEFKNQNPIREYARAVVFCACNEIEPPKCNRWTKIEMMDYNLLLLSRDDLKRLPTPRVFADEEEEVEFAERFLSIDPAVVSKFLETLQTLQTLQTLKHQFKKENSNLNETSFREFVNIVQNANAGMLLEMLWQLKDSLLDFSRISTKEIVKTLDLHDVNYGLLDRILSNLRQQGLVKVLTKNSWEYKKWDLTGIVSMFKCVNSVDEFFEIEGECYNSIWDEVEDAQNYWKMLIEEAKKFNPTDPEPTTKEEEEEVTTEEKFNFNLNSDGVECKLDDSWMFVDRFSYTDEEGNEQTGFTKCTNENKLQEQVCVNKNKNENNPLSRKNIDVEGCNFLLECDDISKVEQLKYIYNLPGDIKRSILWVTDSAGKSIHVVLKTTNQSNSTVIREYILQQLNKHFGGHLDMSAKNAGRLCRNPNGLRNKDGQNIPQLCLYYNPNPTPLEVSRWVLEKQAQIDKEKEEWRLSKSLRDIVSEDYKPNKKPLTIETLQGRKQSRGRDAAIAMLEGTSDWNSMVTACRYLLVTGYERSDIEDVMIGDEWILNALNVAERNY